MALQDPLQICCDPITLTYPGLIADVKTLRHKAGLPSADPVDAGYTPDSILQDMLDRYQAMLQELAERRMREQCQEYAKLKDEVDRLNLAAEQRLDAAIEQYLNSDNVPFNVREYAHEVLIDLCYSPTATKENGIPLVSWGTIEEPYLSKALEVVVIYKDGTRVAYVVDPDFEDSVRNAFTDIYRYQIRGRRIFVSNNGEDVPQAIVTVYDRNRLEEFAKASIEGAVTSDLLDNFTILVDDELIADLIPQFNERMILEARNQLAAEVAEGSRLITSKDE